MNKSISLQIHLLYTYIQGRCRRQYFAVTWQSIARNVVGDV